MADFDARPSEIALCYRGPLVLYASQEQVGDEAFQRMIRAFIRENVRTNEELFGVIDDEIGPEATEKLKERMATI